MTLRKSFILYVLTTFALVLLLSGLVIFGCISINDYLLPDSDEVFLKIEQTDEGGGTNISTYRMKLGENPDVLSFLVNLETNYGMLVNAKYSVTSIENSFSSLSPKRQLLYRGSSVAMVALPVLFSLSGILMCGFYFYKRKLKAPLEILSQATDKISSQNLDFQISYESKDELGVLCESFEQMRMALQENNKRLWAMLEERKNLQASVAHDLRNPIAIIEGYAEYLLLNLPKGNLENEKICSIASNISHASKRLERYTESIRTINHLEELEIKCKQISFSDLYDDIVSDFSVILEKHDIKLYSENRISDDLLNLDPQVLYRILENFINNAIRFAKTEIKLSFSLVGKELTVIIEDDGCGFTEEILKSKGSYYLLGNKDEEHMGMGLAISHILCKKHGGSLSLKNNQLGGASVRFTIIV